MPVACRGQASRVSTTSGGPCRCPRPSRVTGPGRTAAAGRPARAELGDRGRPPGSGPRRRAQPRPRTRTQVSAPDRTGAPELEGSSSGRRTCRPPETPNRRAMSCCPAARTLTAEVPLPANGGPGLDDFPGQKSTKGGVSDRAANAWQANPAGRPPSPSAPSTPVMTVTPVQKWPSTVPVGGVAVSRPQGPAGQGAAGPGKAVSPEADRSCFPCSPTWRRRPAGRRCRTRCRTRPGCARRTTPSGRWRASRADGRHRRFLRRAHRFSRARPTSSASPTPGVATSIIRWDDAGLGRASVGQRQE